MPETFTDSLRRRIREEHGGSIRALGRETGVSFNVISRFLRGMDIAGRNIDPLVAYLDRSATTVAGALDVDRLARTLAALDTGADGDYSHTYAVDSPEAFAAAIAAEYASQDRPTPGEPTDG